MKSCALFFFLLHARDSCTHVTDLSIVSINRSIADRGPTRCLLTLLTKTSSVGFPGKVPKSRSVFVRPRQTRTTCFGCFFFFFTTRFAGSCCTAPAPYFGSGTAAIFNRDSWPTFKTFSSFPSRLETRISRRYRTVSPAFDKSIGNARSSGRSVQANGNNSIRP